MARKKAPARARGAAAESRRPLVTIRVGPGRTGVAAVVARLPAMMDLAAEWSYILRNRYRWSDDDDLRAAIRGRAVADLETLGISRANLEAMARAGSRQLEIGFNDPRAAMAAPDTLDDAASVFPWEFVLSSATREVGRSHAIVITRWLESAGRPRGAAPAGRVVPRDVLFVQSLPGRLEGLYGFDSEFARLSAALGKAWAVARNASPAALAARIAREHPKKIHVSGVDNHQAARLIDGFYTDPNDILRTLYPDAKPSAPIASVDGMVLRGDRVPEQPVGVNELAASLVPKGESPWMVSLNLHYSGARTARECVRLGARAAMGFLDEIDDELAEYFFQAFYTAWRHEKNKDLSKAFANSWRLMRDLDRLLYGTGIVLWRGQSAFAGGDDPILGDMDRPAYFRTAAAGGGTAPAPQGRAQAMPISQVLQVSVDVPAEVNYSLLHNGRPFLDGLTLSKLVDEPLNEVQVRVDLNVGEHTHPFRHTEAILTEPQLVLTDKVRVPLTAQLLRTLDERVQTTVYVRVKWNGRTACEQTRPVTLLPVDEWFDDTEQNPWLPSFILPRDPAVAAIVGRARPHLVTLQDDPNASFDGYQSGDDDPTSTDRQVQALWTTLVQDYRLLYVNPPPAYSARTQRLRTPSEIVATGSGTCVDLALLLASCLEYMDIYPVVVLLSGHAFAGYWRTEPFHQDFCAVSTAVPKKIGISIGGESVQSAIPLVDTYKWRLSQQQYLEIVDCVRQNQLRMLEATGLCFNYSFADAVKEGRANLRPRADFDSLLDVKLARSARPPVTPLPIAGGDGRRS